MKSNSIALLAFVGLAVATSQASAEGLARTLVLPALDVAKARSEDVPEKRVGEARRFGILADAGSAGVVEHDPRWERAPDGRMRWTLDVHAPGALALDFAFSRFRLPAGAELMIRSEDRKDWIGPFTDADNRPHGEFYTQLLLGERATLELRVPEDRVEFVELELGPVNRAYRGPFGAGEGATSKSGSCNVDVACPQGDPWRAQIASVAGYAFRSGTSSLECTGQLLNATNNARRALFSTANHCVATAAEARSMVLYWRYESPTCRAPGSSASGVRVPLSSANYAAVQSGATLRATTVASDFTLVELDTPVPTAANAFFSGWDRREVVPASTFSIHHPSGHEKRISFDNDPPVLRNSSPSFTSATHFWRVLDWDLGTTEGGSSGSGLWNPQGRLIGVLTGGGTTVCGPNMDDHYGRLSTAWTGGGTPASRLSDWLDPGNTGASFIDGIHAGQTLEVALASTAFATPPTAGDDIVITATASGGRAPYTYRWDTDGDGVFERSTSEPRIEVRLARRSATQVRLRVTDADGLVGETSRALDVRGAVIEAAAAGAAVAVCGNGNAAMDPGERWRLPVRLTNTGNTTFGGGHALFHAPVATSAPLSIGPNAFGYRGGRSQEGTCNYAFLDIAGGANAVPALALSDNDDGRTVTTIALGGTGFPIYGERRTQAVMSTNGYVSFSAQDSGRHWPEECDDWYDDGAVGPHIRPLFDDLVVNPGGGLRYRYFASCPRQAEADNASPQGCHVFQWNGMRRWTDAAEFSFQAIAYERSGQVVFQYPTTATPVGSMIGLIGLVDAAAADPLQLCDVPGTAQAQTSICLYAPNALPGAGGPPALRLPRAAQAVPMIPAGGSVTIDLPLAFDPGAACGSSFAVDFIAAADARAHSTHPTRVLSGTLAASCQATTACPVNDPQPTLRQGLYFDERRDGNGLNTVLVPQGDRRTVFGALWYTGLRDHSPVWYQLTGPLRDLSGELPLLRFHNSAAPGGFAPVSQQAGRGWVGFADDGTLMLAWDITGHGRGAERMTRLPQPFATPNHTTAWYNPAQDGWGLAIESLNLGTSMFEFVAAYLYDAAGHPRWTVGSLPTASGGTFQMHGYLPHCPGCPRYSDVQTRTVPLGPLTLQYPSPTSATMSSQLQFPPGWSGTWNRSNLPLTPIVPPAGGQ